MKTSLLVLYLVLAMLLSLALVLDGESAGAPFFFLFGYLMFKEVE